MSHPKLSYMKSGLGIADCDTKKIALAIIKSGGALKGEEVAFIRYSLGFSMEKLGYCVGVNSSTVMRWEHSLMSELSAANDLIIRTIGLQLLTNSYTPTVRPTIERLEFNPETGQVVVELAKAVYKAA